MVYGRARTIEKSRRIFPKGSNLLCLRPIHQFQSSEDVLINERVLTMEGNEAKLVVVFKLELVTAIDDIATASLCSSDRASTAITLKS